MDSTAVIPLLMLPLLGAGAYGLGTVLCRWLDLEFDDAVERGLIAATLGLVVGGTLWVLLGLIGQWTILVAWTLLLFSLDPAWRILWQRFTSKVRPQEEPVPSPEWPWRLASLVVFGLLGWMLLLSQTPNALPDPSTHHFLVADLWAEAHGLTALPQVPYAMYPGLLQSLYALGFVLDGEGLASLIGWSFAAGLVLAVGIVGARLWRPEAGIAAALVVLSWESFWKHLLGGWADTSIAYFALIGLYLLWRGIEARHRGTLIGAGLCLGAAIACSKHTALLVATLAVLALAIAIVKSKGELKWGSLGALVGGIVAIAGLWYVRALVLTHNPVYPLTFWGLFPGPDIPIYTESQWSYAGATRPWYWMLQQPLQITFGERDWPEAFQGRLPWSWLIGVPLALWYGWREPVVRWLCGFIVICWLVMLQVAPYEVRYFFFAVPWLALLTGYGLTKLLELPNTRPLIATLFALVVLGFPLVERWQPAVAESQLRWPVLTGQRSAVDYLTKSNHPTSMVLWCNDHLDPDHDRIFALEDRLYRLHIPWTTYFAQGGAVPDTPDGCLDYLRAAGTTHLLLGEGHTWEPSVLVAVLEHPADADGLIWVTQPEVMRNLLGQPIRADKHWVSWILFKRHADRAGWRTRTLDHGVIEYGIPVRQLTDDPATSAAIGVIRAFQQLIDRGNLKLEYTDGLNFVFSIQPPHPPIIPQTDPPAPQTDPPSPQTDPPSPQTDPPSPQTDPPSPQTEPRA